MASDPYYMNSRLALHCTGSHNSTAFTDVSPKANIVTPNGNAKIITTQTDPFGGSSGVGYFGGNGDYLTVPATYLHTAHTNFLVRGWVRMSSLKNQVLVNVGNNVATREFELDISATGYLSAYWQTSSTIYGSSSSTSNPMAVNTWYFIEFSVVNGIAYFFVNGNLSGSFTYNVTNQTAASLVYIGRIPWAPAWDFAGNLYDVQMCIGVDGHTTSYTPPTAPFAENQSQILGTIAESLAANAFIARAYDIETGALVGSKSFSDTNTFTIDITSDSKACAVTVSASYKMWKATTVYAQGDKVFPTNPTSTPYYYKRLVAGVSGSAEPSWPVTPGGQCNDGAVANAWELVERLIQPITHAPLIPS